MEKRKPKVFILGASGFLGFRLAWHLRKDFLVAGTYFRHPVFIPDTQIFPIDPNKTDMLEPLIRVQDPDFIINAVGLTDRKAIEAYPKLADSLNVLMAVSTGALAGKIRSHFLQLSCASVYDGSDGNYSEDDNDFALFDDYGKQKVAAESYIRSQTLESTTFRIGKVLGTGNPYSPTEFDRLRKAVARRESLSAAKKQIRSYISVRSVCEAIELVLKADFPGKHRVFNLGGPDLTEFELYEGWAKLITGSESLIKQVTEEKPRNLTIKCDRFVSAFPDWKRETQEELYLNLLKDLTPGTGIKKWQKTLQSP